MTYALEPLLSASLSRYLRLRSYAFWLGIPVLFSARMSAVSAGRSDLPAVVCMTGERACPHRMT